VESQQLVERCANFAALPIHCSSSRRALEESAFDDDLTSISQERLFAPLRTQYDPRTVAHDVLVARGWNSTNYALNATAPSRNNLESQPPSSIRRDERNRLRVYLANPTNTSESTFEQLRQRNHQHEWESFGVSGEPALSSVSVPLNTTRMDHFHSPAYGSDGSNMSTTQENDPAAYAAYQHAMAGSTARSQNDATQDLSYQETGNTIQSYGAGETGHVTLDYEIPPNHQEDLEEEQVEDLLPQRDPGSHRDQFIHPRTPAPKALFEQIGSIMRPSQLFAATQPSSTGFQGPHGEDLNSSRPSPDLYNGHRPAARGASSPLLRHAGDLNEQTSDALDEVSSPALPHSKHGVDDRLASPYGTQSPPRNSEDVIPSVIAPLIQGMPEPHELYISRRQSQEQRIQDSFADNEGVSDEDDDFLDYQASKSRAARLKKEAAARELAKVGTSRLTGSAESDMVEVPSTSKGRRRSESQEYIAQCDGVDARDSQLTTQQEFTIVDSQCNGALVASEVTSPALPQTDLNGEEPQSPSPLKEEQPLLTQISDRELPEQLPAFNAATTSSANTSDEESTGSPTKTRASRALSEVCGNGNEMGTPSGSKILAFSGEDGLVPETSPLQAHQRHYIGIENEAQSMPSGWETDDVFNPFSQDIDFDVALNPPSPTAAKTTRESTRHGQGRDISSSKTFIEPDRAIATDATSKAYRDSRHVDGILEPMAQDKSIRASALDAISSSDLSSAVSEETAGNDCITTGGDNATDAIITEPAGDGTEQHTRMLRSSEQLKGPSKLLRRMAEDDESRPGRNSSTRATPSSTFKAATRSMRILQADCKFLLI
jgi:hypothetical protein